MQYSQEHLKTMVYAEFGGQTECIMGNSKIETTCQTIKVLVACHTLKVQVLPRKIERNRSFSFFWYSRKIIWGAVVGIRK